jgi:hypothetical protein
MPLQNPQQTSEKQSSPSMSDVVRVNGWYRVRKLLHTGGSGELTLTRV